MEENKGTRKITRRELKGNAKIKIHESSAGEVKLLEDELTANINDISVNGLGVLCRFYIPEGAHLKVELERGLMDPGKEGSMHIVAAVTSTIMSGNNYRIGMQFTEIPEQDKEIIKNYVQ